MDEEVKQNERFEFDGFWKDLIERFWRELLKSVLLTLYAVADLTKELVFLDKELRDVLPLPDEKNPPRFVDGVRSVEPSLQSLNSGFNFSARAKPPS